MPSCAHCSADFAPHQRYPRQKFCSDRCRTNAWTAAHRDKTRAKSLAYYRAHRDERRAYAVATSESRRVLIARWEQRHRPERRAYVLTRKALARAVADGELARGCADCGEKDLRVLDFDHVRGTKRYVVSFMVKQGMSPKTIYAEIDKCEVRCANDHRRITTERRTLKMAA